MRLASLKVQGSGLIFSEPKVLNTITLIASAMLAAGDEKQKIKSDSFEGIIFTNFHNSSVGSLTGTVFDISLESDYGPTSMTFILARPMTQEELECGCWAIFPGDMPEELIDTIISEILKTATQDTVH